MKKNSFWCLEYKVLKMTIKMNNDMSRLFEKFSIILQRTPVCHLVKGILSQEFLCVSIIFIFGKNFLVVRPCKFILKSMKVKFSHDFLEIIIVTTYAKFNTNLCETLHTK